MEITLDNYLDSFTQTTDYPSLDGTLYLLNSLDNPHKKLKFIHIAGTNGKGSITEMLNNILINSGLLVGKFISPHLIQANECVCVNNTQIKNTDILFYIDHFKNVELEFNKIYNRNFTRFEILTALAIDYFYKQNTDIVLLEVGLGGMYDCTNVVTPIVSCFGSISFDHTQILGNTLEEISIQKAGIIKENSNSVIFNQEAKHFIENVVNEKNNTLHTIYEHEITDYSFDKDYQYFKYNGKNYKLNLKGKKQIENACVVLNTIKILNNNNFNITYDTIYESLSNIIHPGRYETIYNNPLVIFDGAHNENALENFIQITNGLYKNTNKIFIISIITTKDYKKMITTLLSNFPDSTFIFTSGNNTKKFFDKDILLSYGNEFKEKNNLNNVHLLSDNLNNLKELININTNSTHFILGSFYVYNTVINLLK